MCASCTWPSNPLCTLHQVMSMILALSQFEVLQHCCHAALQKLDRRGSQQPTNLLLKPLHGPMQYLGRAGVDVLLEHVCVLLLLTISMGMGRGWVSAV